MIESFWSRVQVELLARQLWRTREDCLNATNLAAVNFGPMAQTEEQELHSPGELGLDVVAMHRLNITAGKANASYVGATQVVTMPAKATEYLAEYVTGMRERSEAQGRAQSAWWFSGSMPDILRELMTCDASKFDEASRNAILELARQAPGNAQPGLVVFLRVAGQSQGPSLLCLKMGLVQLSLTRFQEMVDVAQAITVEELRNVLPKPKELKKGALIPHPERAADLRVVDEQMDDAADYWLRFLGARTGPKEPELANLTVSLLADAVQDTKVSTPRILVAEQLAEVAGGPEAVPVREIIRRTAEAARMDETTVLNRVAEAEPSLNLDLTLSPAVAGRTKTIIDLGHGISISGPTIELDKRFSDRPIPGGGWESIVRSEERGVRRGPKK